MRTSPFSCLRPVHSTDVHNKLRPLFEPIVERLGYDLVAVEWLTDPRGQLLRVSVDRPAGISANDCANVSRHLSALLDELDPIEGSYRLEVSSPGIDRPLQRASDFARFIGYRAKVRLVEGHPRRRFTGKLTGLEGGEALIVVDGKEHRFPVDAVERAHLVLDLDEYQRLAGGETDGPEPS